MNLIRPRRRGTDDVVVVPQQRPRPRYETTEADGRTDLTCGTCGTRIAFAVDPSKLDVDAPFFLDAHAPFCMGGAQHRA